MRLKAFSFDTEGETKSKMEAENEDEFRLCDRKMVRIGPLL